MVDSNLPDILNVIEDSDLPILKDIYKDVGADLNHVYNYLSTITKLKKFYPNYFKIMVPGDWKTTGTFIGMNEFYCYELFMCTLEENRQSLYNSITQTKQIDWKRPCLVYSLSGILFPIVTKALKATAFQYVAPNTTIIWRIPKEKAINFAIECPDEVYISELKPEHAEIVNSVWPPRYINSQKYLATLIEINGGYGVFLKSNDELVSWGIRNLLGLGAVQTLQDYSKKGYGTLITAYLSQKIAETGYNPLGTVRQGNIPSERMFSKLGFEAVGSVRYICNQQMINSERSANS